MDSVSNMNFHLRFDVTPELEPLEEISVYVLLCLGLQLHLWYLFRLLSLDMSESSLRSFIGPGTFLKRSFSSQTDRIRLGLLIRPIWRPFML